MGSSRTYKERKKIERIVGNTGIPFHTVQMILDLNHNPEQEQLWLKFFGELSELRQNVKVIMDWLHAEAKYRRQGFTIIQDKFIDPSKVTSTRSERT